MDDQEPSFPGSRHRREGGRGHVRVTAEEEEGGETDRWGHGGKEARTASGAGWAAGKEKKEEVGRGEMKEEAHLAGGFSLHFHLKKRTAEKTQKEKERGTENHMKI